MVDLAGRVVVGLTPGWFTHPFEEGPVTAEQVAGHVEEIRRAEEVEEPKSLADHIADTLDRLGR